MKGYTLIEMIISVLLLAMVLMAGTSLFYQNLKAAGLSDVDSNLGNALQTMLRSIEKDIRFSTVTAVGTGTRTECLAAGVTGYGGGSLTVNDVEGHETIYSLSNNKVASTAAETGVVVFLNVGQVLVTKLEFTWFCQGNISDKIKIVIDGSNTILNTGIEVKQSVSADINLLNSGLN